jgi:TRAP-type C4-dicarboxylate transport system permease large subunit
VLIAACSIARSDIWETTKANLPFIGVMLMVLMICTYVPWFALAPIRFFYGA